MVELSSLYLHPAQGNSLLSKIETMPTSELMVESGLIRKESSGVYGFLPLGAYVKRKVNEMLVNNFEEVGFQEVSMGILQNVADWKQSKRWEQFQNYILQVDLYGSHKCLSPTHEEAALKMMRESKLGYRDLPLRIFQIGKKFRGHKPRSSLRAVSEFEMLDAYMVHTEDIPDHKGAKLANSALNTTFKSLNIETHRFDKGLHLDFLYFDSFEGDRELTICPQNHLTAQKSSQEDAGCSYCGEKTEIKIFSEIARIQELGTELSRNMNIGYNDNIGNRRWFNMICCGAGIERIIQGIITSNRDNKGINWPECVRPFYLGLIPVIPGDETLMNYVRKLEPRFAHKGRRTIIDNRELGVGRRSKDLDLIGCKKKIIIGEKELTNGFFIIEDRDGTKERSAI